MFCNTSIDHIWVMEQNRCPIFFDSDFNTKKFFEEWGCWVQRSLLLKLENGFQENQIDFHFEIGPRVLNLPNIHITAFHFPSIYWNITSSWKERHTLANCNGQKEVDFLLSRLTWVGNWPKQKFSPMALRDIASSKICLLTYFSHLGFCWFLASSWM